MSEKLAIAMFGQKRLSREGGVEIVVKELCTRMDAVRRDNGMERVEFLPLRGAAA